MKSIKLKIKKLKRNFKKLEKLLINPNLNFKKYKNYNKNYNKIKKIINYYNEWKKYKLLKLESINLLKLEEIKPLALEDIKLSKINIKFFYNKLKKFFYKKFDIKKFFLEIRIGTGGEESAIFVSDLYKMYIKYIEKNNWKYKLLSSNATNLNGYKYILILINNKKAYNYLKFESGVHRVQRSPKTENKGRIHTSTCKVAIIPKLNEKKIKLTKKDFKIETFKSSGAGGQHVNKTNSAVRIKHIPTGLVVECQNERSQHKNKAQALNLLKSKIYDLKKKKYNLKKNKIKKNLLGKGNRSEKIRTYNYKKNRFTDHRINLISYKLNSILDGNLDEVLKSIKSKIKSYYV